MCPLVVPERRPRENTKENTNKRVIAEATSAAPKVTEPIRSRRLRPNYVPMRIGPIGPIRTGPLDPMAPRLRVVPGVSPDGGVSPELSCNTESLGAYSAA